MLWQYVTIAITVATKENHINCGYSAVGEEVMVTFTLTNLSNSVIRFQWPVSAWCSFMPSIGHLSPTASKDINVQIISAKPRTFKQNKMAGKYSKIEYKDPLQV